MFRNIPIVTKNLLIINVVVYLASLFVQIGGKSLEDWGALHFFLADDFNIFQFFTYQFLHGSFTHLFFNMFALWMFGCVIENVWGPKRFIFYYIVCGVFAGVCQEVVQYVQYFADSNLYALPLDASIPVGTENGTVMMTVKEYFNSWMTIGASGAVYAILLAFGMTFPNERIFIFPLPVPIKAKWFILIYAGIELFSAISSRGDGIAHMAHLGGMLSGFLLILYWRKSASKRYNVGGTSQFFNRWGKNNASNTRHSGYSGNTNTSWTKPTNDDMEYNARKKARQDEIDAILDKIRKSGYDSLTKEEKQRLFEASHEQ